MNPRWMPWGIIPYIRLCRSETAILFRSFITFLNWNLHSPTKKFSNTSSSGITMNKHLLEWSRQYKCKYANFNISYHYEKYRPQIYYITCYVTWTFFYQKSRLVFKSNTRIGLKCTWNPNQCNFNVWINQQIWLIAYSIALEFPCSPLYICIYIYIYI